MSRPPRIDTATARELKAHLEHTPYGERGHAVAQMAERYGVSVHSIYRALKRVGFQPRKERQDAGRFRRPEATAAACETVLQVLHSSRSRKYTARMSLRDAIEEAERRGSIGQGQVTAANVRLYMRRQELQLKHFKAGTPHQEIRYSHPNQVHQVDFSPASFWYLKTARDDAPLQWGDPTRLRDTIKRPNGIPVVRCVLSDLASGCFYVQFAHGYESAEVLCEFLHRAWSAKREPEAFPFCGVPEHLAIDCGPAGRSGAVHQLLQMLEVEQVPAVPKGVIGGHGKIGHPRARGGVESAMWTVERWVEWRVAQEQPRTIPEANRIAEDVCGRMNAIREHSRFQRIPDGYPQFQSRSACFAWFARRRPVRTPPPLAEFMALTQQPETRQVDGKGWFSFRGDWYRIDPRELDPGNPVLDVWPAPFRAGHVRVRLRRGSAEQGDGELRTIRALTFDGLGYSEHAVPFGEYRAFPDTPAEAFEKGRLREREAERQPAFLPPKAEAIEAERAPETTYDELQAIDVLRRRLERPVTAIEVERLRAALPGWRAGRIAESDVDAAAELLEPVRLPEGFAAEDGDAASA